MTFASRVSAYNRERKWKLFLSELPPDPRTRVLDVGYSDAEYSNDDNFIEKRYPYQEMLTALGIQSPVKMKERYPKVNVIQYDGTCFPWEGKEFDVCWSNAVLEHVGDSEKQVSFLKEIKRVSRKAFITTPNRWFPIETHTRTPVLHYFPKKVFDSYLRLIGKGWASGGYMHLLGMSGLREILKNAGIEEYKLVENKLLGFTLTFVIIFESK